MAGHVGVMLGLALAMCLFAVPGAAATASAAPGAILYDRGGNEDDLCGAIWSVEPNGGQSRRLDVGPGNSCDPDWSPDGRHFAFSSNQGGARYRIYVAEANGAHAAAVTQPGSGAADFMPAWSPDGSQIAFERRTPAGNSYNLLVVNADGTNARQLTHRRGFDGTPSWSPDGRVLFVSDRPAGRRPQRCDVCSALYIMRLSDGRTARITRRSVNSLMPAWSRDGMYIAWGRGPTVDAALRFYVMRSDRTDVRQLDRSGESPAWSPDSRTIVYSSDGGLALIGVDGTARRQLTSDGGSGPSWRPVSAGS